MTEILYHGTDSKSAQSIFRYGIDLNYGDKSVDNGPGFYLTPNFDFAKRRADSTTNRLRLFNKSRLNPAVLEFTLEIPDNSDIVTKKFDRCTYEWKEFIFNNRIGKDFLIEHEIYNDNHNLDFKYDIVIDETADAHINMIIADVKYNFDNIDLESEINLIDKSYNSDWDIQVSLHSQKALSCIVDCKLFEYKDE